jgi:transposase
MRTGRPKVEVILSEDGREQLERWSRRPKTAQALAQRARIVLACAAGESNDDVGRRLKITAQTVGKWRRRFVADRLEGLLDEPRVGAPRKILDADVERVLSLTLETKPKNATHWSTRSMAEASGLTQTAVSRVWRAFALQPHRTETFKLSKDPQFIEKVRDIVGLYMNPPARALVLCVDEKSQIQALDRTQPIFPMRPGQAERRTHDYARYGPPHCSRLSTWSAATSSASVIADTGASSSGTSSPRSMPPSRPIWTFIWFSTTTAPTSHRPFDGGSPNGRGSSFTSLQPVLRG